MKKVRAILLYFMLVIKGVAGQEVNVTAAFDTSRILIGDQINYTVTVDKPVSYILSIPVFRDTLQKNIEILQGPVTDSASLKDGRIRIRQKYLVTSFDSGFYQVPPVYAELRSSVGIRRFYSDYAPLEVLRVRITPPDSAKGIFDIIMPYKAPLTLGEILPWLLPVLILFAAVWYIVRFVRKRKSRKSGYVPVKNPDPAHIIAFRELEKLKKEKLWQKGETKHYYTRLTEIVREYLENRFRVYSMELTTGETLDELLRTGFSDNESFRKLRTVLTGSDLVKFAKYNPEPLENESHFDYAWDFVSETKIISNSPETDHPESDTKEGEGL
jgi:hypothetical protein